MATHWSLRQEAWRLSVALRCRTGRLLMRKQMFIFDKISKQLHVILKDTLFAAANSEAAMFPQH